MEDEKFCNDGIFKSGFDLLIGDCAVDACVIGLPRSGTSLISSILHNLGVFTGSKSRAPTYEDKLLKDLLDAEAWEQFLEQVRAYRAGYGRWAFKLPRATYKVKRVVSLLDNPLVICSIRDPLAIQIRKNTSQKKENVYRGMKNTLMAYQNLMDDLQSLEGVCPVLMISYDKVSQNVRGLVSVMAELFLPEKEVDLDQVVRSVEDDQKSYVENARFDKSWGRLESRHSGIFEGWALLQNPRRAEVIEIELLNEKGGLLRSELCHVERNDIPDAEFVDESGEIVDPVFVRRNKRKFNEAIGFRFECPEQDTVKALRVRGDRKPFVRFE